MSGARMSMFERNFPVSEVFSKINAIFIDGYDEHREY
jgi:hypothetical protein